MSRDEVKETGETTSALAEVQETKEIATKAPTTVVDWMNESAFAQMGKVASILAKSTIVPNAFQGKPSDCLIAVDIAARLGLSPITVMQNLYVVKGKPSWSGQACMAMINASPKFKNAHHVYFGQEGTDGRGCYVEAERISDGTKVKGASVTLGMAKGEGWTSNSKWRNMPELMLSYRAAAFFARVHCPEQMMGFQTVEEVEDVSQTNNAKATSKALDAVIGAK